MKDSLWVCLERFPHILLWIGFCPSTLLRDTKIWHILEVKFRKKIQAFAKNNGSELEDQVIREWKEALLLHGQR